VGPSTLRSRAPRTLGAVGSPGSVFNLCPGRMAPPKSQHAVCIAAFFGSDQQPLHWCRFPFAEPLTLHSGETVSSAQVVEAMSQFTAPERLARMDQVLPLVWSIHAAESN
jgi:hypothetical protein